MKTKLIILAVTGTWAAFSVPAALAEDSAAPKAHSHPEEKGVVPSVAPAVAEPASPHTFAYNVGLFSQYIFRGLTQTSEEPALQGGVDYSHASGFYLGAWASNISWLEDGNYYNNSSLELDLYGGYRNTIGKTGIGYDVGVLQYIYPGDVKSGVVIDDAETTEIYGALSYNWVQGKVSYVVSEDAWGTVDGQGTWYAELNANIPLGETGFTANLHVGRQEFDGDDRTANGYSNCNDNDSCFTYTDWKIGLTKSFSNGVNIGGFYTDTDAKKLPWTLTSANNRTEYIGDSQFTVFVQKTF